MTSKRVVEIIRQIKPVDLDELDGFFSLNKIGEGSFRAAYHISGSSVVVKFPLSGNGVRHSRREIKVMRAIVTKKKFRHLARYCPNLLYADEKTGILGVELCTEVGEVKLDVCKVVAAVFKDTLGSRADFDLSYQNLGRGRRRQIKILDFGLIRGVI
jgi:hypothetical protein